jgi:hypothetical protein
MKQFKVAAPAGACVLGAALTVAGCARGATSASAPTASTSAGSTTTATASAAATTGAATATDARVNGTANIMLYSINTDGPGFRAVVTGVIGDYGAAVTVTPNGQVDSSHGSELELRLTRGSFRLNIAGFDQKFAQITAREPIYRATCSDLFRLTSDLPVVADSGSGAYRGITGGFAVALTGDEVHPRPCTKTLSIAWQVLVIAGSGHVADLRYVRAGEGKGPGAPSPATGRRPGGSRAVAVQRLAGP